MLGGACKGDIVELIVIAEWADGDGVGHCI